METKLDAKRIGKIRLGIGFTVSIEVGVLGSCGGLCLAWKGSASVSLWSFSQNHINFLIKDNDNGEEWWYTGFYDSPFLVTGNES